MHPTRPARLARSWRSSDHCGPSDWSTPRARAQTWGHGGQHETARWLAGLARLAGALALALALAAAPARPGPGSGSGAGYDLGLSPRKAWRCAACAGEHCQLARWHLGVRACSGIGGGGGGGGGGSRGPPLSRVQHGSCGLGCLAGGRGTPARRHVVLHPPRHGSTMRTMHDARCKRCCAASSRMVWAGTASATRHPEPARAGVPRPSSLVPPELQAGPWRMARMAHAVARRRTRRFPDPRPPVRARSTACASGMRDAMTASSSGQRPDARCQMPEARCQRPEGRSADGTQPAAQDAPRRQRLASMAWPAWPGWPGPASRASRASLGRGRDAQAQWRAGVPQLCSAVLCAHGARRALRACNLSAARLSQQPRIRGHASSRRGHATADEDPRYDPANVAGRERAITERQRRREREALSIYRHATVVRKCEASAPAPAPASALHRDRSRGRPKPQKLPKLPIERTHLHTHSHTHAHTHARRPPHTSTSAAAPLLAMRALRHAWVRGRWAIPDAALVRSEYT